MIPESFIQELLLRIDIVDLIDGYVPLKKAGANYVACCPFHNEKTPSFTVSSSKQFYHCFGCGAHGTAIGFLMEYSGIGFVDALKELANRAGVPIPQEEERARRDKRELPDLAGIMAAAARYYYKQMTCSERAIAYLKSRGLQGDIVKKFGIGYAPDKWRNLDGAFEDYADPALQAAGLVIRNEQGRFYDRFRDRIMFPIINQKGEVIAFGGRILDGGEPKYLNSPETPLFEKGREVYGLPQARAALREKNTVIVVEGYMDVIALSQHGVGNAVATLGTATTLNHVQKLFRQAGRVVFCFDGDGAGRKAAWKALENSLEALPEQKSIGFVFLPDPEDPDSFIRAHGKEAFERLIAQATPLSEFLLRELASHSDMGSAEGRAALVSKANPLLNRLRSPLLRLQIVKRLAETSGFSTQEIERLCGLRPIVRPSPPKAPRRAYSVWRRLLRLLLQKPELAHRLPPELLDGVSPDLPEEARATKRLHETILAIAQTIPSYAMLLEKSRGDGSEPVLREIAAELMEIPLVEEDIETEFAGVVECLTEAGRKRDFETLQKKVARLGIAGLTSEEKEDYLMLISRKNDRKL
ncbi:MAG: DNA primase [Candidatus Accumulibacter sp.]|jgi:DNA primase|nr:DNA primase [Accumulibacter sp.]